MHAHLPCHLRASWQVGASSPSHRTYRCTHNSVTHILRSTHERCPHCGVAVWGRWWLVGLREAKAGFIQACTRAAPRPSLLNPFRTRASPVMHLARDVLNIDGSCSSDLTTFSDDSKPYMILVALIKAFQNHIGFAIIRASGEEQEPSMFSTSCASRVMHVS